MKVLALAVMSLDGCLTRPGEAGVSFSSAEDRAMFSRTMRACGAVIMGRLTFEASRAQIERNLDSPLLRVVMTRCPERHRALERPGALEFSSAAPAQVLLDLEKRGYRRVVLAGGPAVYDLFARNGLVSEWWITVEPHLLGSGARLLRWTGDPLLSLLSADRLGPNTVLLKYAVRSSPAAPR